MIETKEEVGRYQTGLTDEELVALTRTGDTWAVDVLVFRYKHFAKSQANSYFIEGADREDIVQEALIGLCRAIKGYNLEGNVPFRAFADLCIRRQIISAIKASTRFKHLPMRQYVSLHDALGKEGRSSYLEGFLTNKVPGPEDIVINTADVSSLADSVADSLSGMESDVLGLYLAGIPLHEIASRLELGRKTVYNALHRIKEKTGNLLQARRLEEQLA